MQGALMLLEKYKMIQKGSFGKLMVFMICIFIISQKCKVLGKNRE
jgi:hypothetical protein